MNIRELMEEGRTHWSQFYPDHCATLADRGELEHELEASALLTRMEMDILKRQYGYSEAEAWQASRELFLIARPCDISEEE
jgi:hypothetical protein